MKAHLFVLAAALAVLAACGVFGGRAVNQPSLDVFACQLSALSAAVPAPVAEDLVMALRAGNAQYAVRQLLALGLDLDRINALAEAYNACTPPAPDAPPSVTEAG